MKQVNIHDFQAINEAYSQMNEELSWEGLKNAFSQGGKYGAMAGAIPGLLAGPAGALAGGAIGATGGATGNAAKYLGKGAWDWLRNNDKVSALNAQVEKLTQENTAAKQMLAKSKTQIMALLKIVNELKQKLADAQKPAAPQPTAQAPQPQPQPTTATPPTSAQPSMGNKIGNAVGGALNGITSGIGNGVGSVVGGVADGIGSVFSGLGNAFGLNESAINRPVRCKRNRRYAKFV